MSLPRVAAGVGATVLVVVALTACSGSDPDAGKGGESPTASATPSPAPTVSVPVLGGASPTRVEPPAEAMNELEAAVAEKLAVQVAPQGLTLEYLDCPDWDGEVPADLTCQGFFDGVPGDVSVGLTEGEGGGVSFDAELQHGVLSSANLVSELVKMGYPEADCGDIPAYPTQVGDELVCAVTADDGTQTYVVATVTDPSGSVSIKER